MKRLEVLERVVVDLTPLKGHIKKNTLLGEGAFGVVYSLHLEDVARPHCVKIFKSNSDSLDRCMHEANALMVTKIMKGVPRLVAVSIVPPAIIMTMHGPASLVTFCMNRPVDEKVLLRVLHSLAGILATLHCMGLSHNDIKANNVLVKDTDDPTKVKVTLIDLGLVTRHGEFPFGRLPRFNAKPFYAPELMHGIKPTSEATDMYSFGFLLKCLLPLLPITLPIMQFLSRHALDKPSQRPSFIQARNAIRLAARSINAWPSNVSPHS